MRFAALIAFAVSSSIACAQADLWSRVDPQARAQQLQEISPTDAQFRSIDQLLRQQKPEDIWECAPEEMDDLIKGLRFESIPIAANGSVMLVEAPRGCARGGQGANGAMWLIRFDRETPVLLASPKEFSGWLFSVQPLSSHGYSDIILGWHMGAGETVLSYFRYDGKSYHKIGTATLQSDQDGNSKVVANPQP